MLSTRMSPEVVQKKSVCLAYFEWRAAAGAPPLTARPIVNVASVMMILVFVKAKL